MTVLPQLASADDSMFKEMSKFSEKVFKSNKSEQNSRNIFCSELVAAIYSSFGLDTFTSQSPGEFTPLELEVAHEFAGRQLFAKENKVMLFTPTGEIPAQRVTRYTLALPTIFEGSQSTKWIKVDPLGDLPPNG